MKTEMKPGPYFLSFIYFWEETMVSPVLRAYGLSELIRMLGATAQGATAVTTWGSHGRLSLNARPSVSQDHALDQGGSILFHFLS